MDSKEELAKIVLQFIEDNRQYFSESFLFAAREELARAKTFYVAPDLMQLMANQRVN